MLGQKTNLSKRIREMRACIALQGQARKFNAKPQEEKFTWNRELLPQLREAVQEDVHVLGLARKVAQEKLRAEIYERVNTYNMLLYQVKQRSRAQEQLQRRLQQLQDVQLDEKQHQEQVVRTLESSIEKMQTKVHAGQKVTALYLGVRDALRKELAHLTLHVDVLSERAELQHGEVEEMELMAADGLRAARVSKQARLDLFGGFLSEPEEDPVVAAELKAMKSRMEREALVKEKMERAKAAVQSSCLWDVPARLLAQQRSLLVLEQYLGKCKEKKQELKKTLQELEKKRDELKFRRPPDKTR
ncbi:coiled-coil domain-containing protein 183-like [Amazona ochrocephala]